MARPRKKQRRDEGPKGPVGTTTALHTSARNGDAEAISRMLAEFKEKSCEQAVDARDEHGRTPLHLASWAGAAEAVEVLLRGGADGNLFAQDAMTALHFAAQSGCLRGVEALIAGGSALDAASTKSLKTPLHLAAAKGHAPVCAALVAAGADATAATRQGQTALDLAAADDVKEALATPVAAPDVKEEAGDASEEVTPPPDDDDDGGDDDDRADDAFL